MRSEFEELSAYLKTIPRYVPMSREEEARLARAARRGETSARDELVRRNLAFVVAIARKHAGRGARLDDLVQEGNVGLLRAIEKFDTKRGTRFSTYAIWWIRAYIQKYLKECHSSVRGGEDGARKGLKDVSLDVPVDDDSELTAVERLIDDAPPPDTTLATTRTDRLVRARLDSARKKIGEMGWSIVRERLESDEPQTLEQLGRRFGVSRERVRQVELKTRSLLRTELAGLGEAA